MQTDQHSQHTQSQTPHYPENAQLSSNQSMPIMYPQLEGINENEEIINHNNKPRPSLKINSSDSEDPEEMQQDSSPSEQKTLKNHRTHPSQSIQNNSKMDHSSKTPQDFEEEIIPQVRQMMKQNTYISQVSIKGGVRVSRLQSLQHSHRPSKVVPEIQWHQSESKRDSKEYSENDSFFEETEDIETNEQCRYRFDKRYLHLTYILFPDDPWKLLWDFMVILSLLYVCFILPFDVAFSTDQYSALDQDIQFGIGIVVDIIYGFDIIITLFTAYLDNQDDLITDRRAILSNYIKGWFALDLICIIPLDYVLEGNTSIGGFQKFAKVPKAYRMVKLLKMSRVFKFCLQRKKYGELLTTFSNQNVRVMIISLISVLFVSHLFSCIWYFVGTVSSDSQTWIIVYVNDEEIFERYIMSFYWVFQTMATTGYGDISATNSTEQLLGCFLMIFGVAFFSVTIGSVSSLLTQLDSQNLKYKEKMDIFNEIARNHQLDNQLYAKICKVLKNGYKNNQNEVVEFLHFLPQNIRTELSQAMYRNVFSGIELFKNKPLRFTAYIGPLLTILRIQEGDIIYNEGDYANEIYFIKEGQIAYCIKEYDYQAFYVIEQGSYFGEHELIKETSRQYTVMALKQCEILSLSKANFYKIFFSEFRDIGEELHEQSRRIKMEISEAHQKLITNLEKLEQKADQEFSDSPTKQQQQSPKQFTFQKQQHIHTKRKHSSPESPLKEDIQSPNQQIRTRLTKLKTVLLQKGIIQNKVMERSNEPRSKTTINMAMKHQSTKLLDKLEEPIHMRNPKKKSLTMLMKQEEVKIDKGVPNSSYSGNIEFLKNQRKGKQLYL